MSKNNKLYRLPLVLFPTHHPHVSVAGRKYYVTFKEDHTECDSLEEALDLRKTLYGTEFAEYRETPHRAE